MNAQQLKNSILQMAIQGKLVPQDPTDEPASVLLERIRKEKEQLIKSGKIKSAKHESVICRKGNSYYETVDGIERCIDEEVPFDIPDNWEWGRLLTICTKLVDGAHNPPKGESIETPYIMISSTNINNDTLTELSKVRYLSKYVFMKENERTQATKGDVFLTSVGSLGRSCVYAGGKNICFQRSVSVLTTLIYNYYLKYYFDCGYIQQKISAEATGTAQKGFYLNQLAKLLVPVPPLTEQRRIVEKIEETLPFIEKYGESELLLSKAQMDFPNQLKKSILQLAVQGKLVRQDPSDEPASVLLEHIRKEKEQLIKAGKIKRDKHESVICRKGNSYYETIDGVERCIDEEVPFDIPDSWEWVRLRQIVFNHGQKKPTSDFCYIDIGSIDNKNQLLNENETILNPSKAPSRARKIIKRNDIIYSTVRPYLHNMCIISKDFSREAIASTGFAVLATHAELFNKFLFYCMLSPNFDSYANNTDNAKGVAYPAINDEKLYNALIPLPPVEEQHRIVVKIEELMAACNKI